jgi:isopentenyl-diphosphate delta-isomerase
MENRKKDHINLAFESQMGSAEKDNRFYYEPMLHPHPLEDLPPFTFLGKKHRVPMWVSSMTGGTGLAGTINTNLARACREFGMGMGLGSCRIILDDNTHFRDFDMREIIGADLPLYANLGISQIEQMLAGNTLNKAHELVERLRADGLIVHVNPLQEWLQPEGDRLRKAPIDTLKELLNKANYPVIVKEVGQGMGPSSIGALLQLPLEAIELAAFGGTNFAKVELMRSDQYAQQLYEPIANIGETAPQMVEYINNWVDKGMPVQCRQIIISGGIRNFMDGYYLLRKCRLPAIYGQASAFLRYAKENYEDLQKYIGYQVNGLKMAFRYLTLNE